MLLESEDVPIVFGRLQEQRMTTPKRFADDHNVLTSQSDFLSMEMYCVEEIPSWWTCHPRLSRFDEFFFLVNPVPSPVDKNTQRGRLENPRAYLNSAKAGLSRHAYFSRVKWILRKTIFFPSSFFV